MSRRPANAKNRTKRVKARARPGQHGRSVRKIKRWSQRVTQESNALDLEPGVFTLGAPRAIAASLKRSALRSRRRKAGPYRSALSMLTFYINRAGRNLPAARRRTLEQAKRELRVLFAPEHQFV